MLYNTAVVWCAVVLCGAISLPVEAKDLMQLDRNNNGVVENVTSSVDDDRHPYKANKRLRRSTWTEFVNAIAEAVDAFHAKPLLAVATNDVENVGRQLEKDFGKSSKSFKQVMLNKGVKKGSERTELNYDEMSVTELQTHIDKFFKDKIESIELQSAMDDKELEKLQQLEKSRTEAPISEEKAEQHMSEKDKEIQRKAVEFYEKMAENLESDE